MDASTLASVFGPFGALVLAVTVIWLFVTEKIVPGGAYREMRNDRNNWRDAALTSVSAAEAGARAVEVVQRTRPATRRRPKAQAADDP